MAAQVLQRATVKVDNTRTMCYNICIVKMDSTVTKQQFTPEEVDDIRSIALYLRKYKYTHTIQQIITWAVDEFLRRRYVREKGGRG